MMEITATPFLKDKSNPYASLLYNNIIALGHKVTEFGPWSAVRKNDIVHVHWPERYLAQPDSITAKVKSLAFFELIRMAKCRGAKVIWTVHNLANHESGMPLCDVPIFQLFIDQVDGTINLSRYAESLMLEQFPQLDNVKRYIIPHGHYRDVYRSYVSRNEARKKVQVPLDSRVIAFIGQIRPYKNVDTLIKVFREISDKDLRLLIGGTPSGGITVTDLESLCKGDDRIVLQARFLSQEEISNYFAAADLVVLPFQNVLNSGSVLLSLSLGKPVLVPQMGSLVELAADVGSQWIMTYHGMLSKGIIEGALDWAIYEKRPEVPDLNKYDWRTIAHETLSAYSDVINALH